MMNADEEDKVFDAEQPQRLSEFFFPVLQSLPKGNRVTKNIVKDAWSKVMGAQTSRHVRVVEFSAKRLRLSTKEFDWYRSVQKNKDTIIQRLNAQLEGCVIEDVEVAFTG
jgi:hypothetical protein